MATLAPKPESEETSTVEQFKEALASPETLQVFLDKLLNIFRAKLKQISIPLPVSEKDITKVQLQDMTEKIEDLKKEVEAFRSSSQKDDSTYRRLTEACVKYSIQLDRINVIGRDEERQRRKRMLIEVDGLSTNLVQIYEDYKNSK